MYRKGLLFAVHSSAHAKWQLIVEPPSWKAEFVITEVKHL
jgi:hypothetical protein